MAGEGKDLLDEVREVAKEQGQEGKKERRRWSMELPVWLVSLARDFLVFAAACSMVLWVYHQRMAPRVVTVNYLEFVERQAKDFAAGKITREEGIRRIEDLKRNLAQYPANTVVIDGSMVVISGEKYETE